MNRTVRAAGFAAAGLLLVAAAAWSDPLKAVEGEASTASVSFIDHAAAQIEIPGIGYNGDGAEAEPASAAPVSEHERTPNPDAVAENLDSPGDAAMPSQRPLVELIQAYSDVPPADREQDCLANAVYFEARGEPIEGQLAVAEVVLNRARSGRYPGTICEVVTQPWQFSFVRRGVIPAANRRSEAWRRAVAIARIAVAGASRMLPRDVLWYHADYVSPRWGRRLARNTKIGLHIFYS